MNIQRELIRIARMLEAASVIPPVLRDRANWRYEVKNDGNLVNLNASFRLPGGHITGAGIGIKTYVSELEKSANRNGILNSIKNALSSEGYDISSVDVSAYADVDDDYAAVGEIEIIVKTESEMAAKSAARVIEKAFCSFISENGFKCKKSSEMF